MTIQNFQNRVDAWMLQTFDVEVIRDKIERIHRFVEEALELAQSLGYTKEQVDEMSKYVFDRPEGDPVNETGGVMVTLAALCSTHGIPLQDACHDILVDINERSEQIRQKHNQKPDSVTSSKNSDGDKENTMP